MFWNLFRKSILPEAGAIEENKVKSRKNSGDSGIEVEDSFIVVPENLTFAEIANILSKAINENDHEKLDNVIQDIEDYKSQSITLDNENFKNFCLNQLNLDLQRSDRQHIYSNILLQYSFNQVKCNYSYPVKELLLLAIAANDELTEKHQDVLFAKGNLSLLSLLVGSQKYVEIFTEKFPNLYQSLKNQTIQLENGQIGFFSVIALRQERELLDTVLIECVLRDLEQVLKITNPDSTYGILETASLVENRNFMEIVLYSLERYVDDQAKKDLLKNSIVTFLETAINQEHVSIVEYLCRECIAKKGPIIQEIYKEAFTDERIVAQINEQILKNIHSAGVGRKEKKQKIYDLILKAALHTGSTGFIIKVLDLITNDPKFLGDTDRQTFLQNSLVTILDNAIGEKRSSIIQNVYANFILKLAKNSRVEFLTIQQKYQNACHTSINVDNSVASQLNEKEPNGDDSSLEQDEFEITDIQEERRPGILGSNKTEIAGFSQEKLLEIINFVKVGYYVGDCNLNNKKFSELEKRFYRVPAQLEKEGYKVIQFCNMRDNGQPYRHAGYVFIKDKKITIVYRGSRNIFDYAKDLEIPLTDLPGNLVPKGGKVHSGFYSLFKDSWDRVYEILRGYANDQQLEIKDFKINLAGHSMGGAIANIAALYLSVIGGAEDLHVATFASPRVLDPSAAEVYEERLGKNTIRVVNLSDIVPSFPLGSMGYKHVGEQLRIKSDSYTHSLDAYRNLIVNIEPDKFKSDNSVSIYYYPSYLVTALYNVFTAPSYLIPNTHSNGDEQYFKQVKNKHKNASLSKMMQCSGSSNEQKALIYEDYELGEDGFITFQTLRNAIGEKNLLTIPPIFNPNIEFRITSPLIDNLFAMVISLPKHGRGEGLKVNVPDIAFFINNNYYLSGNTIGLRRLKTSVDNYPGSLAFKSANSHRVEDNVLAQKGESDTMSSIVQKHIRNKSVRSEFVFRSKKKPSVTFTRCVDSNIEGIIKGNSSKESLAQLLKKEPNLGLKYALDKIKDLKEKKNQDQDYVEKLEDIKTFVESLEKKKSNKPNRGSFSAENNSRLAGEGDQQGLLPSFSPSPLMSDDKYSEASSIDSNCSIIENNVINKEEPLLGTANSEVNLTLKSNSSLQGIQPKTLATSSELGSVGVESNDTIPSVDIDHQPAPVPSVANKNSDLVSVEYQSTAVNNYTTASKSDSLDNEFFNAEEDDSKNKSVDPINNRLVSSNGEVFSNLVRNHDSGSGTQQEEFEESSDSVTSKKDLGLDNETKKLSAAGVQSGKQSNCASSVLPGAFLANDMAGTVSRKQDAPSITDVTNPNSGKIQLDESRTGSDQVSNQSTRHITQMDNERAPLSGGNSKLKSNQQDLQPEVLPTVPNGKQSANPNNGGVTVPSVQLDGPESVDKNSGKQDTQPKPSGVALVASKDSKRVSNAQGNSKHPSYPGQNNPAPRNAKSKLPMIAASMLVITGVATGIAIAVYLEMLAVGIAVGACCLVAAAIIYCCNKSSNSLEKSSAEAVAATIGTP